MQKGRDYVLLQRCLAINHERYSQRQLPASSIYPSHTHQTCLQCTRRDLKSQAGNHFPERRGSQGHSTRQKGRETRRGHIPSRALPSPLCLFPNLLALREGRGHQHRSRLRDATSPHSFSAPSSVHTRSCTALPLSLFLSYTHTHAHIQSLYTRVKYKITLFIASRKQRLLNLGSFQYSNP